MAREAQGIEAGNARPHRARLALALLALLVSGITLPACGGSAGTPARAEVEQARKEGEASAHERDQVSALKHRVEKLEHRANAAAHSAAPRHPASAESPAAAPVPSASASGGFAFHTPSGNVACVISAAGAACSVASAAETFAFHGDEPAEIQVGLSVETDSGQLVEYGSTFSEGAVTCTVPPANVPHGVSCSSAASGHGFEASRVTARQQLY